MRGHPWHDVPLNDDLADWFPVFLEINRGCRVKYELDKPTGLLRVDRILYGAVYYPASYGFVPRTYCADGDPLDALVICKEDLVPGVLVRARAVGVMPMRDEKGQDDKLIAVHVDDPFLSGVRDLSDLSAAEVMELRRFFQDYKVLEGKEVVVDQPLGREAALQVLRESVELHAQAGDRLRQGFDENRPFRNGERVMRLLCNLALAALPCLFLAGVSTGARADEKVPVKDLPQAVVAAIEKRLPGAELLSAKKEKDDGKIKYEVKVKHDGKKYEVEVTPDGKILEVEREDD